MGNNEQNEVQYKIFSSKQKLILWRNRIDKPLANVTERKR